MTRRSAPKKRSAAKKKRSPARKRSTAKKKRSPARKRSTAKKKKRTPSRKRSTAKKKKRTTSRKRATAKKKKRTTSRKRSTGKKKRTPSRKHSTTATRPSTEPAPQTPPAEQPAPQPGGQGNRIGGAAGIRIRMYRVGFGDFFLLTLTGADGVPRHILIDCGVHAMNLGSIQAAISQLKADTGGQLALVIMTHRHADHISGFGIGASDFATFTVERVWMPWFENPNDPQAAAFQASLTAVASRLQLALAANDDPDNAQYLRMAQNITGDLSAAGGGGNAAALQTLHGGFKNKIEPDYYEAGQKPTLPDSLVKAGLTAQILGPPRDPNLIAIMDNKAHQYLDGTTDEEGAPPARLSDKFVGSRSEYPPDAFALFSADRIEQLVGGEQPDIHLAMAAKADNTINNQSLVVLFTFNGKTLLFPGDAQWGNWDNWLFGGNLNDPQLSATAKDMLGKLDFYKVGHHGSTNANPKDAVEALRQGCVAMVSTQPTAYGKPSRNSEVPRGPLLDALTKKTNRQLARSDQVALTADQTGGKAVPPWPGSGKPPDVWPPAPPLTGPFKTGPNGTLYIDYEM